MAKPKKTTAAGCKQRALKGRAFACAAAISRFEAAQGKEVHELRVQQAAHARAFKTAKLGKPTQPKDSDK
uniref:Uncharacterized protein n=1 Tax=Phytophthora fragariae TaxID=53985 RepID=A0A6A3DB55_9STRA|nr:hypothetical protein PF009_g32860 [Phytophthora fragariae]